jgi:hypothetical protein
VDLHARSLAAAREPPVKSVVKSAVNVPAPV